MRLLALVRQGSLTWTASHGGAGLHIPGAACMLNRMDSSMIQRGFASAVLAPTDPKLIRNIAIIGRWSGVFQNIWQRQTNNCYSVGTVRSSAAAAAASIDFRATFFLQPTSTMARPR